MTNLVGDFGGTNARLAISSDEGIREVREYSCDGFDNPSAIIAGYLSDIGFNEKPKHGLFAVAGAAEDPENVIFTNGPWKQQPVDFTQTPVKHTDTLNDFDAICFSTAQLRREETRIISAGSDPFYPSEFLSDPKTFEVNETRLLTADPSKRFITVGPGTGLGVAGGLVTDNGQFMVLGGEGGHTDFSADSPRELELRQFFESQDIIVTNETIASGTGLRMTFNAVCEIRGLDAYIEKAADLPTQLSRSKPLEVREAARWTLSLFAETLGKCTSAAALVTDARTVFLAGGVIPKLGENFYKNAFTKAFRDNDLGANNELVNTPIVLITHKQPGLLGAHSKLKLMGH